MHGVCLPHPHPGTRYRTVPQRSNFIPVFSFPPQRPSLAPHRHAPQVSPLCSTGADRSFGCPGTAGSGFWSQRQTLSWELPVWRPKHPLLWRQSLLQSCFLELHLCHLPTALLGVELIGAAVSLNARGRGTYVDALMWRQGHPVLIWWLCVWRCAVVLRLYGLRQSVGDKAVEEVLHLKQSAFCFCALSAFFAVWGRLHPS